MQFEIILNQILFLAILIVIGVIATRLKVVNSEVKESLASIIFNITLPLLILTTFSELRLTPEIAKNGLLVLLFSFLAIFFMYLGGLISSKVQKLDQQAETIHILHTMFGNIVFLGFPLIDTLFPGGEGLLYATLFYLASSIVMWTFGVYVFNRGNSTNINQNFKNLLNPNTFAFVLGILVMIIGFKIPNIIHIPLKGLGKTTIYLSMIYIGAILAQTNLSGIFRHGYVFVLSINKMVLLPLVLILLLKWVNTLLLLDMDQTAFYVVILQAAMPCMAVMVVLAKWFGADDRHATENFFVSTILSLLTLPLIIFVLNYFAG